jgi:hypothetical protein
MTAGDTINDKFGIGISLPMHRARVWSSVMWDRQNHPNTANDQQEIASETVSNCSTPTNGTRKAGRPSSGSEKGSQTTDTTGDDDILPMVLQLHTVSQTPSVRITENSHRRHDSRSSAPYPRVPPLSRIMQIGYVMGFRDPVGSGTCYCSPTSQVNSMISSFSECQSNHRIPRWLADLEQEFLCCDLTTAISTIPS